MELIAQQLKLFSCTVSKLRTKVAFQVEMVLPIRYTPLKFRSHVSHFRENSQKVFMDILLLEKKVLCTQGVRIRMKGRNAVANRSPYKKGLVLNKTSPIQV